MAIPKRIADRISQQVKHYQSIIADARNRDISESDTVVIIADMLADVLGYRKYTEITTEFAIRGTYVDLAVKVGDEIRFLLEAKAVGVELKDSHVKQAIDYGANQGIEWVILTNAAIWRVYRIHFRQPVDKTLVCELDMLNISPKNDQLIEALGTLSRERFDQGSMKAFYNQRQVLSRFSLGALLLSDPIIGALRKELRRLSSTVRVDDAYLRNALAEDVLKREIVDSDEAAQAAEMLKKMVKTQARKNGTQSKRTSVEADAQADGQPEILPDVQ